jgi:phage-related protein
MPAIRRVFNVKGEYIMAIQQLSKEEVEVVSGGALDLSNLLGTVLGLVTGLINTVVGLVGTVLGLVTSLIGTVTGLVSGLVSSLGSLGGL